MHEDNLAIESQGSWAVPTTTKQDTPRHNVVLAEEIMKELGVDTPATQPAAKVPTQASLLVWLWLCLYVCADVSVRVFFSSRHPLVSPPPHTPEDEREADVHD